MFEVEKKVYGDNLDKKALAEYYRSCGNGKDDGKKPDGDGFCTRDTEHIAEEAADTITAITSMLEAMGIDENMRQEAQKRVNERNMEKVRL